MRVRVRVKVKGWGEGGVARISTTVLVGKMTSYKKKKGPPVGGGLETSHMRNLPVCDYLDVGQFYAH